MDETLPLLGQPESEYGPQYREHYLQVYKTYVDIADRVSARRETANSFFLTLNTGLLGVIGFLAQASGSLLEKTAIIPVSLAGVVTALVWRRLLRSYREVNAAKFRVIHQLEASLPARPYNAERQDMQARRQSSRYWRLSHVEALVPLLLALLHLLIAVWAVPWAKVAVIVGAG
jgi:hypothetical protein